MYLITTTIQRPLTYTWAGPYLEAQDLAEALLGATHADLDPRPPSLVLEQRVVARQLGLGGWGPGLGLGLG